MVHHCESDNDANDTDEPPPDPDAMVGADRPSEIRFTASVVIKGAGRSMGPYPSIFAQTNPSAAAYLRGPGRGCSPDDLSVPPGHGVRS